MGHSPIIPSSDIDDGSIIAAHPHQHGIPNTIYCRILHRGLRRADHQAGSQPRRWLTLVKSVSLTGSGVRSVIRSWTHAGAVKGRSAVLKDASCSLEAPELGAFNPRYRQHVSRESWWDGKTQDVHPQAEKRGRRGESRTANVVVSAWSRCRGGWNAKGQSGCTCRSGGP